MAKARKTMTVPEEGNLQFDDSFCFDDNVGLGDFEEKPATQAATTTDTMKTRAAEAVSKYDALEAQLTKIRQEKGLHFEDLGEQTEKKPEQKKPKKKDKKASKGEEMAREEDQDVVEKEEDVKIEAYFDMGEGLDLGKDIDTFADLNLSKSLLKGLAALRFDCPTPIQKVAIPVALMGKDICGGAVTGSGKTAAFLIPIIERLLHRPKNVSATTRVLILLPTRELAVQCNQVAAALAKFTDVRVALAAGGLPMRAQEAELRHRPEIVVATPGRLIDHLRNSPSFTLDGVEILVLDEADRMLEEGFADELDEIIRHTPKQRQTILFSATMTDNVDELVRLSLRRPVRLFVDSNTAIARKLQQEFVRIRQEREEDRLPILLALCHRTCTDRCIIFFPTKELAHRFRLILGLAGLRCAELHGGLSQAERLDALERFKTNQVDFLAATDVAARGLDIQGIRSVLNYSMPVNYKMYLHRVGRTARAGHGGMSITLAGEGADRKLLKMVIKNSTVPVKHRQLSPEVIEQYRKLMDQYAPDLESLLEEDRQTKLANKAEQELRQAENILKHDKEIAMRPKKTWFQSNKDKLNAKTRDIRTLGDDVQVKRAKKQQPLRK